MSGLQGANWGSGHLRDGNLGFGNPFLPQEHCLAWRSLVGCVWRGRQGKLLSESFAAVEAEQPPGSGAPRGPWRGRGMGPSLLLPRSGVWEGEARRRRRWSGLEGCRFRSAVFGKPGVEQLGCTGAHWDVIPPIDSLFQPPRCWRGPGMLCRAMGMLCSPKATWGAAPGEHRTLGAGVGVKSCWG